MLEMAENHGKYGRHGSPINPTAPLGHAIV
jgi:hypothetical protein